MFDVDHPVPDRMELANGSRAAFDRFGPADADLVVLEITARPSIIASRLAGRGRETAPEIEKRLARDTGDWRPIASPCGSTIAVHWTMQQSGSMSRSRPCA